MIAGRLKRSAGNKPNSRLVSRQTPTTIAARDKFGLKASLNSSGMGWPIHQARTGGMLYSTVMARALPSADNMTASASRYRASRPRLAPIA
jgi:hypothetical protein